MIAFDERAVCKKKRSSQFVENMIEIWDYEFLNLKILLWENQVQSLNLDFQK